MNDKCIEVNHTDFIDRACKELIKMDKEDLAQMSAVFLADLCHFMNRKSFSVKDMDRLEKRVRLNIDSLMDIITEGDLNEDRVAFIDLKGIETDDFPDDGQ